MAKNRRHTSRTLAVCAMTLSAAMLFTACHDDNDADDVPVTDDQQVTNIGINLSAPGLISGTDPATVSGIEVDLAAALSERLELVSDAEELTWVPTNATDAADGLAAGDLEMFIGQFSQPEVAEDIAWVGPYATVEPGLLVRADTTSDDATSEEYIATETVTSVADLKEAAVCVVAGSLADGADIPAQELTTQQTVSECETGMRSGRYDAVVADDLQLAGVLADTSDTYDLLLWSDLAEDDEANIPEQLVTSGQYWIGTTPQQCEPATEALVEMIDDGALAEIFGQWGESTSYQPQLVEADEISTTYCNP